jgi:hypothetical protein
MAWASATAVACDGIVFVNDAVPGYARDARLWKLKHSPTIDFALIPRPAVTAPPFFLLV